MNNDFHQNPNPEENPQTEAPKTVRCPRCGKELPASALFCGECGANLNPSQPQNETYTAPTTPAYTPAMDTSPLKTTDFLILQLLNMIPIVGIVLMLVWSFSKEGNLNRRNFCRSYMIMYAISLAISFIFIIFYVVLLGVLFTNTTITSDLHSAFGMLFH